jgi:hypothetical protein
MSGMLAFNVEGETGLKLPRVGHTLSPPSIETAPASAPTGPGSPKAPRLRRGIRRPDRIVAVVGSHDLGLIGRSHRGYPRGESDEGRRVPSFYVLNAMPQEDWKGLSVPWP